MEITNNSKYYKIPLKVNQRIAQIVFIETDGILDKSYNFDGKYQNTDDLKKIMKEWSPYQILPKIYKDI